MKDCVLYRLPYAKQAYKIEGETTHLLSSAAQLDDVCGFVMAPFRASAETPIVVVEGKAKPVELATESWTNEVAETGRREDYARDFARFHDAISKGQFSKLVLSRNADIAADDELCPELLFAEACRRYPRMTIALVKSEVAGTWLMATPEILLAQDGDRWQTMALAGTMAWEGKKVYSWSDKNKKEHQLVAGYIEEVLKPYAKDMEISKPYTVRAGNLVHLRSDFSFTLDDAHADGCGIGELVEALHPTPAVCGLPKQEAIDFITANESIDRKYYSGYCGPWNVGGKTALFVSLRCMEIKEGRGLMYAGGGLLEESSEESEWQETMMKMEPMRSICTQTK